MFARFYRLIVVVSFYTLAILWFCALLKVARHPAESTNLLLLVFTFPLSIAVAAAFILILDDDVVRSLGRPDHPIFAGVFFAVLLIVYFLFAPTSNPWRKYGVRLHRIQGGSSSTSVFLQIDVNHLGKTIDGSIPGGVKSNWRYSCRDVNADGIKEIIVEDDEGRSVTTFIPAHGGHPPAFKTLEWTWKN